MGLRTTTDSKGLVIYRKDGITEAGKPYKFYSAKVSSQDYNKEWHSMFLSVQFKKGTQEVFNKAKIIIKDGFMAVDEYNGVAKPKIVVTDFEIIEEGENPISKNDDWLTVSSDEDLPFI